MEPAPGRDRPGGRRLAEDARRVVEGGASAPSNACQQGFGVRVAGSGEHVAGRPFLDHAPEVHDVDAVAQVTHDGEVVRDHEVGDSRLLLELDEQVEDLRLDDHVERRGGLVEDEEAWPGRESARDHHALCLSARQLVRQPALEILRQPDAGEQVADAIAKRRPSCEAVRRDRLGHERFDGHPWVESRDRVLEHELDLAAQAASLSARRTRDVDSVVRDGAVVDCRESERAPSERALPRARLADESDDLAVAHGQVDTVHRPESALAPGAPGNGELLHDAAQVEERLGHTSSQR